MTNQRERLTDELVRRSNKLEKMVIDLKAKIKELEYQMERAGVECEQIKRVKRELDENF